MSESAQPPVHSPATKNAYAADWRDFSAWCRLHGVSPLPAGVETIRQYLRQLAVRGMSQATIDRRAAAISSAHRRSGIDPPPTTDETVRATLAVIRGTMGQARSPKPGVSLDDLHRLLAVCDRGTKAGLRDRALLVLAWAGPFRRSELAALDVEDLEHKPDGLWIQVRRAGREEAPPEVRALPYAADASVCPVRNLFAWVRAAKIRRGPVFRPVKRHDSVQPQRLTDQSVALIVKRAAVRAGLDPRRLTADGLRSARRLPR